MLCYNATEVKFQVAWTSLLEGQFSQFLSGIHPYPAQQTCVLWQRKHDPDRQAEAFHFHHDTEPFRKLQQSSSDTSPFYQNSWNSPRGIIKDTQMIRRNELAEHKPSRRKQNFRTRLNMLFKKASYSWKTHNLSKSLANDNQKLCSFWQRTPPQPTTNYTIILPQKQTALPTSPPLNQTKPLKQWP